MTLLCKRYSSGLKECHASEKCGDIPGIDVTDLKGTAALNMNRVILHSDLNNFYASVECLYNPKIRTHPVAVCGSQSTRHGIVLAKNQIAKKFGVKAGDSIWEARSKCPGLVVVRPNYMQYLRFSMMVRKIYENYTNLIEAFGIDENWLDVTEAPGCSVPAKRSLTRSAGR